MTFEIFKVREKSRKAKKLNEKVTKMDKDERLINFLLEAEGQTENATKNIFYRFDNELSKHIPELEEITAKIAEIRIAIEEYLSPPWD